MSRFALCLALVAGCASPARPRLVPAAYAAALPRLALDRLDGQPWFSDAERPTFLVIDVWASYCAPCAKAFPHLNRLDARGDTDVVGISVDEDEAAVDRFLAQVPASFVIVHDPQASVQAPPLAITSLPTVLVVDRAGRVRWRKAETDEADYRALPGLLDELARESSPSP